MAGELESNRISLRPLTKEDLEILRVWDQDEEIRLLQGKRFAGIDAEDWFGPYERGRGIAMAIVAGEDRVIGDVELQNINWRRSEAELRICLGDKTLWNLGLGTEAVRLITGYATGKLGLKSVYLRVYASNTRAIQCYRKCGYRPVGILKKGTRGEDDIILMVSRSGRCRMLPTKVG